jgi:hypothetical protein
MPQVRDVDGSVLQFQYGDDAIDVTKSSYHGKFDFLAENTAALIKQLNPAQNLSAFDVTSVAAYKQQLAAAAASAELEDKEKKKKKKKHKREGRESGSRGGPPAPLPAADPLQCVFNPGVHYMSTFFQLYVCLSDCRAIDLYLSISLLPAFPARWCSAR